MPYRDLRDWLTQVDEMGELTRINGADPADEIGVLCELAQSALKRPALLFDDIPGYPSGYRLAATGSSARRIAMTLGLAPETNILKVTDMVRRKIADVRRIPPRVVETGPVLENVHLGGEVDLYEFPAPKWHELDGGRYIGTADLVITRDPDDNWVNVGTYRMQVHDRNTVGFYISPGKHGRIIREKYYAHNEPCPVAVCFGQDPLLALLAGEAHPWGVSEYEYAGGITGEPIEVIRGPMTGLPIPADAEIAIEGESYPDETRLEGPFGEGFGYYASGERQEPFIKVKSILHRNNPILCAQPPLKPSASAGSFIPRAALVWNGLERTGIPDIMGVGMYMEFFFTVVSIRQRYPGHARQVAAAASAMPGAAYSGRWVIVVDDDIDPTNFDEVMWALATRCEPEMSINILNRCWGTPLDPMSRPGLTPDGLRCYNSRALVDACIPYELKSRNLFPSIVGASKGLRERVEAKYAEVFR